MATLYALSDLHLGHPHNREALAATPHHPDDWLILGGDVGETEEHLRLALEAFTERFARVLWVPGNHELWTVGADDLRGEAKYLRLVEVCREYGVLTPEDPFPVWEGPPRCRVAPLFVLYDYSFRPRDVRREEAVAWSRAAGVVCADEHMLHPDPYESRDAWCAQRVAYSERRLGEVAGDGPLILINHWPLREDLLRLGRIPTFRLWCGTKRTEDWHRKYPVLAVVFGHIHVRERVVRDGVRFEEVSLGYPRDWRQERGLEYYLRPILPTPDAWEPGFVSPRKF